MKKPEVNYLYKGNKITDVVVRVKDWNKMWDHMEELEKRKCGCNCDDCVYCAFKDR